MGDNFDAVEITGGVVRLPRRAADSHKGDYGRVLVVGGSVGFTGAPVLSARAASKSGAGLVYVGVPQAVYGIAAVKLVEEMPFPLPDVDGRVAAGAEGEILRRAGACDVCLIGPGLGGGNPLGGDGPRCGEDRLGGDGQRCGEDWLGGENQRCGEDWLGGEAGDVARLVRAVVCKSETPLVIDADGLNAIAGDAGILNRAACPPVLTPHPGEFERLGGGAACRGEGAHPERLRAAAGFARKFNCFLVLKGHRTVVASPGGEVFVNTTGGPAMAKGGSGDVLAGMIAAFLAQRSAGSFGFTVAEAVCNAVYLHGLAGDFCAKELGEYSVAASDIIDMLPRAMMTVI